MLLEAFPAIHKSLDFQSAGRDPAAHCFLEPQSVRRFDQPHVRRIVPSGETSSPPSTGEPAVRSRKRILEPIDRVSEVLFGLIMVLTFTGSLSIAEAGRHEIRTMLIGAVGCNLAWGIIDGVLYLMGCLAEKGRALTTFHAVRQATDPQKGQRVVADALPPVVASILEPAELEAMRQRLQQLPEPPARARFSKDDWVGAVGVFLLVFLSTLPVALPFLFMQNAIVALRVSNGIAVLML